MNCTATDPSPTPEATRFTEPWRTSPTAKMPGTLVSSRNGSRSSVQPLGRCHRGSDQGRSEETALVALDQIAQPVGARQGSNKDEHRSSPARARALLVSEQRTEISSRCVSPCASATLAFGPHLNVGRLFDLIDQILRHGAGERTAAHQHDHALRVLGEVHRRLAGRICAAHHVDDFALAGQALPWRRRRSKRPRLAADRFRELPDAATALRSRSSARGRRFRCRRPA